MNASITLFIGMFTTLLAIINPLEAIPVFLGLMQGKDSAEQNRVARTSCLYALMLAFFFLLFGTLLLRLFGVPLSMIRVVGGIILTRIGFQMFNPRRRQNRVRAPEGRTPRIKMSRSSHSPCRSCSARAPSPRFSAWHRR